MVTKELILSASDSYILRNNDCGFSLSYLLLHRDLILGKIIRSIFYPNFFINGGGGGGGFLYDGIISSSIVFLLNSIKIQTNNIIEFNRKDVL